MANNLLTILDILNVLRPLADKLFLKIENYYYTNIAGDICFEPMNVAMRVKGWSDKPGRSENFEIAWHCSILALSSRDLNVEQLQSAFAFFNTVAICGESAYAEVKQEVKAEDNRKLYILPDAIAELAVPFASKIDTLQGLLKGIDLNSHQCSQAQVLQFMGIQVNEVMQNLGYTASDVLQSVDQALQKLPILLRCKANYPQVYPEDVLSSDASLLRLHARRRHLNDIYHQGNWHWPDKTKGVAVFVFKNEEEKVKALADFLVNHYKDPSLLREFAQKAMSQELERDFQGMVPNPNHFRAQQLWTKDQVGHHHRFTTTLAKINNREYKLEAVKAKSELAVKRSI